MASDLVTANHLARRAVVYVRQSTPHQVLTNQESLRLQYALRERARALGWHDADVEVWIPTSASAGPAQPGGRGSRTWSRAWRSARWA